MPAVSAQQPHTSVLLEWKGEKTLEQSQLGFDQMGGWSADCCKTEFFSVCFLASFGLTWLENRSPQVFGIPVVFLPVLPGLLVKEQLAPSARLCSLLDLHKCAGPHRHSQAACPPGSTIISGQGGPGHLRECYWTGRSGVGSRRSLNLSLHGLCGRGLADFCQEPGRSEEGRAVKEEGLLLQ